MAERAHHQRHTTTPRQRVWVMSFLGAAAILLGGVLFLATGTSRIAFTWTPQPVSADEVITLAAEPANGEIATTPVETSVEVSDTFTAAAKPAATPAEPTFSGKARGNVTISNRWSKTQPLQAGTRLKSPDGQIFRTQQRVDVAPGGSVTTLIIADVAGAQGALPKGTTFTLPALWAGLQDDITGTSTEVFYGEEASHASAASPALTATELANAEQELRDEAVTQALAVLQEQVPDGQVLYPGLTTASVTKRSGPSIGDAVQSYTLTLTVRVTGFSVDPQALTDAGTDMLTPALGSDLQLLTVDPATFAYAVERYDRTAKRATCRMEAKGTTAPAPSHRLLQHATFAGKSPADARALLNADTAVSNVAISLSPFWTRTIPTSASNVQIEVTRSQ